MTKYLGALLEVTGLDFSTAVAKIIPGATSLSWRNDADNADNLIITDAGVATFRGVVTAAALTLSGANAKIIPGATQLAIRNNADSADNLIISDAGAGTFRSTVNTPYLSLTGANAQVTFNGTGTANIIPTAAGLTFLDGTTGTHTNLSISDAGVVTALSDLATGGRLVFSAAHCKLVPGATDFSIQNNADTQSNFLLTDAGSMTFRNTLLFLAAASKIVPGATSLSLRNNANNADNLIITDAGVATFRNTVITAAGATGAAGFRILHGVAPTSPVNGDMWTTTAGLFVRINGVTKTVTLT